MITPHPRLKVNVAEQLARSIVAAAHAPSPNLVGANESRSLVDGERLFQQPASAVPQTLLLSRRRLLLIYPFETMHRKTAAW
jgi:hypothetical protein